MDIFLLKEKDLFGNMSILLEGSVCTRALFGSLSTEGHPWFRHKVRSNYEQLDRVLNMKLFPINKACKQSWGLHEQSCVQERFKIQRRYGRMPFKFASTARQQEQQENRDKEQLSLLQPFALLMLEFICKANANFAGFDPKTCMPKPKGTEDDCLKLATYSHNPFSRLKRSVR